MNLTSYLIFNGEAEKAANFYADVLNGKIENLYRYDSMPPTPEMPVPEACKQMILHCCITFPGGSISVADTLPHDKRDFGNRGHMLTLHCDSITQAEEMYIKLSEGAQKIDCKLGEAFFAKRYGEVVDRYGILWAIMFDAK
ncbi:VOC family protein [Parabacteroides sp. PF5-9]|uniref:VOC family protein n=1 Tax=Parabacteroides sp. PF5-9 TaxID=1742404 RepID=UPI0024758A8A|nr:VOC family protein [Parabacteroides sp. PF5-9]MDH6357501.1 PhnB protein [Parabacteroides sp. PF5-9]